MNDFAKLITIASLPVALFVAAIILLPQQARLSPDFVFSTWKYSSHPDRLSKQFDKMGFGFEPSQKIEKWRQHARVRADVRFRLQNKFPSPLTKADALGQLRPEFLRHLPEMERSLFEESIIDSWSRDAIHLTISEKRHDDLLFFTKVYIANRGVDAVVVASSMYMLQESGLSKSELRPLAIAFHNDLFGQYHHFTDQNSKLGREYIEAFL